MVFVDVSDDEDADCGTDDRKFCRELNCGDCDGCDCCCWMVTAEEAATEGGAVAEDNGVVFPTPLSKVRRALVFELISDDVDDGDTTEEGVVVEALSIDDCVRGVAKDRAL